MMLLLAALCAVLQLPPDDKIEAVLKSNAGERRYTMLESGKPIGTCVMKTSLEKDGDRTVAVFHDVLEGTFQGEKVVFTTIEKSSLAGGMRLVSMKRTFPGTDLTVSVADGKAVVESAGAAESKTTVEVTPGTVGESAAFRLAGAMEQKIGASFKVDVLAPAEPELQKGWEFRCVAKEPVEIGGGVKVDAFRWELKWELKREPNVTSSRNESYWFDAGGRLLRTKMASGPGLELVLEK